MKKNISVIVAGSIIAVCCALLLAACPVGLVGDFKEIDQTKAVTPTNMDQPNNNTGQPGPSIVISYNLQNYVPVPVAGKAPITAVTNRADMEVRVRWMDGTGNLVPDSFAVFTLDAVYKAEITLTAKDGYSFDPAIGFAYPEGTVTGLTGSNSGEKTRSLSVTYKPTAVPSR